MRQDKKIAKSVEAALALLKKQGVDTSNLEVPVRTTDFRSNDAVAIFAHTPNHFVPGICKECKKPFAHNQPIRHGTRVGYCSDVCRMENWRKTTGVPWTATVSNKEPWDGDPPMIITPAQLRALREIARWFERNEAKLNELVIEQNVQPDMTTPLFVEPVAVPQQSQEPQVEKFEFLEEQDESHTIPQPAPVESTPDATVPEVVVFRLE